MEDQAANEGPSRRGTSSGADTSLSVPSGVTDSFLAGQAPTQLLSTTRPPYIRTIEYAQSSVHPSQWDAERDDLLREAVAVHGEDWVAISEYIAEKLRTEPSIPPLSILTAAISQQEATAAAAAAVITAKRPGSTDSLQIDNTANSAAAPTSSSAHVNSNSTDGVRNPGANLRTASSVGVSNSAQNITHASVPVDSERNSANKRPRLMPTSASVPSVGLPFSPTPTETVIWRTNSATSEIAAPTSVVPVLPASTACNSSNSTQIFNNTHSLSSMSAAPYSSSAGTSAPVSATAPTALECSHRWDSTVRPAPAEMYPEWSQDEVSTLITLVTQQQQADYEHGGSGKVNWHNIALLLARKQADVVGKYNTLHAANLRHGNFTPQEDAIIIQRFIDWQREHPTKTGLWVLLEKELNRKDKRISERWRHVLSKRFNLIDGLIDLNNIYKEGYGPDSYGGNGTGALEGMGSRRGRRQPAPPVQRQEEVIYKGLLRWDEMLDARLREAVAMYPRDWVRISMHVGVEANGSKCRKRWARLRARYRKSVEGGAGFDKSESFHFSLDGKDGLEGDEGFGELGDGDDDGLDIDAEDE